MKLEEIDKNFMPAQVEALDLEWYDVRKAPFDVYGLIDTGEQFVRLPADFAKSVNSGVDILSRSTAGGRVRFSTDSDIIALTAIMPTFTMFYGMTILGSTGFDAYLDKEGFCGAFAPDIYNKKMCNAINLNKKIKNPTAEMRAFTVNFPLYNEVASVYIGIKKGSRLEKGTPYKNADKPIVYYGSSITQGASASKPGMAYQNIVCRKNNIHYINLGFSGAARGEKNMAEYSAAMNMSAFVYDYDHNAPTAQHLKETHKPFLDIIRNAHPDIPVIMLTKPCTNLDLEENRERREIILDTYNTLKAQGDKNVYFIDGSSLFNDNYADDCFIDLCHPTDLGFTKMAEEIIKALDEAGMK